MRFGRGYIYQLRSLIWRKWTEAAVQEAVFRYQIAQTADCTQFGVYFLTLGSRWEWRDPPDRFMLGFRNHQPAVKPRSACQFDAKRGVIDKATGTAGILFYVQSIVWAANVRAHVEGGWYLGRGASHLWYLVEWKNDQWTVTAQRLLYHRRLSSGKTISGP